MTNTKQEIKEKGMILSMYQHELKRLIYNGVITRETAADRFSGVLERKQRDMDRKVSI